MDEIGIEVPAHLDEEADRYVVDCPFPAAFDAETKRWLLDDGAIGWDEVLPRWKARGPMNEAYVEKLQRGYRTTRFRRAA
jgi:ring-1,2-phenylacetyl-CoA epoxidase subunit PaaA